MADPEREFSPEQQVMIAVLARQHGRPLAERIVDADRVEAYRLGAILTPHLERLVASAAVLLAAFTGATHGR